jgi:septal ring factor EnvC (AmiA/AmiB activator)
MTIGLEFIWNIVLTLVVAPIVWALAYINKRVDASEATHNSLWKAIAETRENIARSYVTRDDLHHDLDRIMQRFDRLEEKLDRLSGAKQ